ncbi:MAG TPA: PQQ-binding-like beta-propeller repeat protein [Kofleriaceae bacterium]|nr:PQQ-binding-like beta-propeller repeat protein [Kofleriaceae bacterium]
MSWSSKHGDGCARDHLPVPGRHLRTVRWRALPELPTATFAAVDDADRIYVFSLASPQAGTLWCLDANGHVRWHSSQPRALMTAPAVDAQSGQCLLADGVHLWSFSGEGEVQWQVPLSGPAASVQLLPDGSALVLGADFTLHQFCARTGARLGDALPLPVSPMSDHVPRGLKSRLLAAALRRIGVPGATAPLVVARFLGLRYEAKHIPAADPAGRLLCIGCMDGQAGALFGVEPPAHGGRLRFHIRLPGHCDCSPILDPERRRVYVFDRTGLLQAIDMETGHAHWQLALGDDHAHSPCAADGMLYFGFRRQIVAVADRGDQAEVLWRRSPRVRERDDGRALMINSSLCVDQDYLYGVAHAGGRLGRWWPHAHALFVMDRARGDTVGVTPLPHESFCTLSMLSDGTVLVPSKPVLLGLRRLLGLAPDPYHGLHAVG